MSSLPVACAHVFVFVAVVPLFLLNLVDDESDPLSRVQYSMVTFSLFFLDLDYKLPLFDELQASSHPATHEMLGYLMRLR